MDKILNGTDADTFPLDGEEESVFVAGKGICMLPDLFYIVIKRHFNFTAEYTYI